MSVAACIVTRGNVDLAEILAPYPRSMNVHVWDNSIMEDLSVYGRYAMLADVREDIVIVQDDDVVLPWESIQALIASYEPDRIVANMPQEFRRPFYQQHCLLGFGSIFDKGLDVAAHARFLNAMTFSRKTDDFDQFFKRTCDVIFTALTPYTLVDLPVTILDYARDEGRMFRDPNHTRERQRALDLSLSIRGR